MNPAGGKFIFIANFQFLDLIKLEFGEPLPKFRSQVIEPNSVPSQANPLPPFSFGLAHGIFGPGLSLHFSLIIHLQRWDPPSPTIFTFHLEFKVQAQVAPSSLHILLHLVV